MIQYHIFALLSLAVAAVCAIEAAVRFAGPAAERSVPLGVLMIALFAGCIFLYFQIRAKRKKALRERN